MEKGGVIVFLIVVICIAWVFNKSSNYTGQATLNTPTATEQPKPAGVDINAIAATKNDIEKCRSAAPFIKMNIQKLCKPDTQHTVGKQCGLWKREADMLASNVHDSSQGAQGITQIEPATFASFKIDGNGDGVYDIKNFEDNMATSINYLCRLEKSVGPTDMYRAYNAGPARYKVVESTKAYDTFVRSHGLTFDQELSQGPMVATLANTASPATTGVTHAVDGPPRTHLFASNPLKGFIKWFSAYANHRADGDRVYPHAGIDAGCIERGQPVLSVCDGKVETSAELPDGRAGLTVIVACSDGMHKTSAMHLDGSAVSKGTIVKAGQEIGACGTTGNAERGKSGPHVHFKLERLIAGVWTIVSPCAGMPNETVLNCGAMWGPNTDFAPLSTIVASN